MMVSLKEIVNDQINLARIKMNNGDWAGFELAINTLAHLVKGLVKKNKASLDKKMIKEFDSLLFRLDTLKGANINTVQVFRVKRKLLSELFFLLIDICIDLDLLNINPGGKDLIDKFG